MLVEPNRMQPGYAVISVFLAAVRTQDIAAVGEETTAVESGVTLVAGEAIGMPMSTFKRDELCPIDTCIRSEVTFVRVNTIGKGNLPLYSDIYKIDQHRFTMFATCR